MGIFKKMLRKGSLTLRFLNLSVSYSYDFLVANIKDRILAEFPWDLERFKAFAQDCLDNKLPPLPPVRLTTFY